MSKFRPYPLLWI